MNIRKDEAGYVTDDHIKASGFIVTKTHSGQGFELYDYHKDGKLFLTGGYWTYYLKDRYGNLLFEGWWNSNEEFNKTIEEAEKTLNDDGALLSDKDIRSEVSRYETDNVSYNEGLYQGGKLIRDII